MRNHVMNQSKVLMMKWMWCIKSENVIQVVSTLVSVMVQKVVSAIKASVKQDNFLGTGAAVSLGGTRNDYGTSINLGYTEPYFTKMA